METTNSADEAIAYISDHIKGSPVTTTCVLRVASARRSNTSAWTMRNSVMAWRVCVPLRSKRWRHNSAGTDNARGRAGSGRSAGDWAVAQ